MPYQLEWVGQIPLWVLLSTALAMLLAVTAVLCRLIDQVTKRGLQVKTKAGDVVTIGPAHQETSSDSKDLFVDAP